MRTVTNTTMNTVEELETELELLWTLLIAGEIDMNERNALSTAIQNEISDAKKS